MLLGVHRTFLQNKLYITIIAKSFELCNKNIKKTKKNVNLFGVIILTTPHDGKIP